MRPLVTQAMQVLLKHAHRKRPELRFDLNFYTTGQIEFAQGIHRAAGRRVNVQQTLVGGQLKLLTAFLVHVRRTQYSKDLATSRQRNRSCYHGTGATHRFNDLIGRFIYQIVIVRLQFYSDSLRHEVFPIFFRGCKGKGEVRICQIVSGYFSGSLPGNLTDHTKNECPIIIL